MTRIAKSELHDDPLLSIDRLLRKVDSVTSSDIKSIASSLLSAEPTLAVIGPFDDATSFDI